MLLHLSTLGFSARLKLSNHSYHYQRSEKQVPLAQDWSVIDRVAGGGSDDSFR